MTVVSTDSRKSYAGNGVTTSFATSPVIFFDSSELTVYVVTTATGVVVATLVEDTDYTVSGGDGTTGTINTAAGSAPYGAPAAGTTLLIVRELPLTQESDFVNNDPSDAEVAEDALDRLTMMLQQLNTQIERSFVLPTTDVSGASTEIPTPVASSLVGWNGTATALQLYTTAVLSLAITTAFTLTLLDDANADTFVQTLVAALTAETAPATDDVVLIGDTSEGKGNKMTLANLWTVINSFTEDVTPDKTADFVASYDTSAAAAKRVRLQELPLPRSYLSGLEMSNNGGDPTNDINIAAGEARDSGNVANILLGGGGLTKQLDAVWAVGSAAGMRASGAAIANTTYFIFVIKRPDTGIVDVAADTSATGANIAANTNAAYTQIRRIGAIVRSGGTILAFIQDGDKFVWNFAVGADVNANNPGTAAVTRTLTLPVGIRVEAILVAGLSNADATGGASFRVSDLSIIDVASTVTNSQVASTYSGAGNTVLTSCDCRVHTNTSAQVRSRAGLSSANISVIISAMGWVDRRGRDA